MSLTTLFHGTDDCSARELYDTQTVDVTRGIKHADFGQGFYLTDDFERAVQWARHKAVVRCRKAAVVSAEVDLDAAKEFMEQFDDDIRWGRFIINNRNGIQYIKKVPFKEHNLDARYSITYGRIADIDVLDISKELNKSGMMLMEIDRILNRRFPFQYAFHTNESTRFIRKITYQII